MALQTWIGKATKNAYVIPMENFPKKFVLTASLADFVNEVFKAEADGIRFRPMRNRAGLQILRGEISQHTAMHILCAESSSRSEVWPWQWMFHKNKKLALISYLGMPYRNEPLEDSIWGIRRLTKLIGPIPATFYPNKISDKQPTRIGLPQMLTQIYPEMLEALDINNPDQMNYRVGSLGYTGYTLDLMHILRGNNWMNYFREASHFVHEIHIPHNRTDFNDPYLNHEVTALWNDIRSKFVTRTSNGAMMLSQLKSASWKGRIVLERVANPDESVKDVTQKSKQLLDQLAEAME